MVIFSNSIRALQSYLALWTGDSNVARSSLPGVEPANDARSGSRFISTGWSRWFSKVCRFQIRFRSKPGDLEDLTRQYFQVSLSRYTLHQKSEQAAQAQKNTTLEVQTLFKPRSMESSGLSFALARNQGSGKFKPGLQEFWTTMGCGESGLGPNSNKSRFVISNLKSPSILSHESKAYKFLEKILASDDEGSGYKEPLSGHAFDGWFDA